MVIQDDFVVTSPFPDVSIPRDVDAWTYLTRNFHNYPSRPALVSDKLWSKFVWALPAASICTGAACVRNEKFSLRQPLRTH